VVLILLALLAFQQPAFEVASVKPTPPETRIIGDLVSNPGGRVLATRCTLEYLLEEALRVERFQLTGGPGWLGKDYFDVDARPPASSKSSKASGRRTQLNDEQRQMLLALLVERFQLKYHRETRQGPVYLLVRTDKKLKLEEAKDKDRDDWPWVGSPSDGMIRGDGIAGRNISMPVLASRLGGYMERPVLDRSGLVGTFDFEFKIPLDEARPDVVSSTLFSIQQLGLKLESAKGPVETVVIDHVEKPSEN
jgi:uncharacterized protein (TIGR03435 family)